MRVESGNETTNKNQTVAERRSDRELVLTRTFNAPARIVFDAWTKPELVMRWWAPRSMGMQLVKCEIDLRVGGKYRYAFQGEGGQEFAFWGVFREIERPTRLVWSDDEQAPQEGEAFTSVTFTEKDGKTTLVMHQCFASKESLDEMLSGTEQGMRETFAQLDELLATIG